MRTTLDFAAVNPTHAFKLFSWRLHPGRLLVKDAMIVRCISKINMTMRVIDMGFLSGVLGNAAKVDIKLVHDELKELLLAGERIEYAYKLIRDLIVFTNKRLIQVDIQGITGSKVFIQSIPYASIRHFGVETSGTFDLDSEVKIWLTGGGIPLTLNFKKETSVFEIQRILAGYILDGVAEEASLVCANLGDGTNGRMVKKCNSCGNVVAITQSKSRKCEKCGGKLEYATQT